MKVRSVVVNHDKAVDTKDAAPAITVVTMSGPVDRKAAIVQEARRLIESLGSVEALQSFDAALESEAFILDKSK